LMYIFFSNACTARARGTALTLFLLFFLSVMLGWSVVAATMPVLFHGVMMGLFGVGAVVLTYELFWPASQPRRVERPSS
jgi:TctA family transporter